MDEHRRDAWGILIAAHRQGKSRFMVMDLLEGYVVQVAGVEICRDGPDSRRYKTAVEVLLAEGFIREIDGEYVITSGGRDAAAGLYAAGFGFGRGTLVR